MLLLVVLLIIALLALVSTTFSFKMQSDLAAVKATQDLAQAEHAARVGIDRAIFILRSQRVDIDQWYNNPEYFRRTLVWAPDKIGGSESLADQEAIPGRPAWRVSVISYYLQGIEGGNNSVKIRYGVTDEASKININTASRAQLLAFFDQVKPEDVTSEELADALLDWRDDNDEPTSINGAESSYYMTLDPPYRAKNRPFETVEELLMVKGFNGRILYGEDYNRNGYLDPNEDDGPEGSFPPDNGDNKLDRGLLPYFTVYSWDWNLSNDNKRRLDLNRADFSKVDDLPEPIRQEIRPEILDFIAEARKRGYRFKSVGELYGLQVFEDGSSNYDDLWRDYVRELYRAGLVPEDQRAEAEPSGDQAGQDQGADNDDAGADRRDGGRDGRDSNTRDERDGSSRDGRDGGRNTDERSDDSRNGSDRNADDSRNSDDRDGSRRDSGGARGRDDSRDTNADDEESGSKNSIRRNQSIRSGGSRDADQGRGSRDGGRGNSRGGSNAGSGRDSGGNDEESDADRPDDARNDDEGGDRRRGGRGRNRDEADDGGRDSDRGRDGRRGDDERRGDDRGRGGRDGRRGDDREGDDRGGAGGPGGGRGRGTPVTSPVTPEDMAVLMDRLTANSVPATAGLVNVNTALMEVIRTIPGLKQPQAQAEAIVEKRTQVDPAEKLTPAWLVTSGAVDAETFALISNQVTTRSIQFAIDAIGFADHTGAFKRLQAVVEMRGQLAQLKYYRDISSLGMGYPVRDDERSEGFAFDR